MGIYVQVMVGGNVILTFDQVDVELTRGEADELKELLDDALARSEHNFFLVGVNKSQ